MNELKRIVAQLGLPRTPSGVLATLVNVEGSSYRRAGARLSIDPSGESMGSISGGCLEEDVRARARNVAATGRPELVTYDTTSENDLVWGVGLGCHGVVSVLIEPLPAPPAWAAVLAANLERRRPTKLGVVWRAANPAALGTYLAADVPAGIPASDVFYQTVESPPALTIFGAGDDAQPLVRLARELGWHVTVADPRAAFATAARFPLADAIEVAPASMLVARCAIAPDSVAVVMTHRYVHDVPILRDLFARDPAYIGLLGPRKRAERILADLAREGVAPSSEAARRFHAPVGLDLGADSPEEVALSIVAEIQAALASRDARPLRERTRPIHG